MLSFYTLNCSVTFMNVTFVEHTINEKLLILQKKEIQFIMIEKQPTAFTLDGYNEKGFWLLFDSNGYIYRVKATLLYPKLCVKHRFYVK